MKHATRQVLMVATALGLVALTTGRASAASIVFTETVVASGTLGKTPFTAALLTFTSTADTANILGSFVVLNASTKVNIAGLGDATFTVVPTKSFVVQGSVGLPPIAGLASGAILDAGTDILDIANPAFATYDLRSSIGPLSGPALGGGIGFTSFSTSAGPLAFTSFDSTATFQAVLQPDAIPEPAAIVPAGTALVVGLGITWSRRKRA
jgi:hypothetical protein